MNKNNDIAVYVDKFRKSVELLQPIYAQGLENGAYYRGDNWSRRDLELHRQQGFYHAFAIPLLAVKMNRILANQRQNRFECKVRGRGMEDELTAEVLNMLIKFVDDDNNGKYLDSEVFQGGITEKYGISEIYVDFNENPQGEIRFDVIPFNQFYWDTNAKKYNLHEDATFLGTFQWIPADKLQQMYPDFDFDYADIAKNYSNSVGIILTDWCDQKKQLVKVCNHFEKEYRTKYLVKNLSSGDFLAFDSKKESEEFIAGQISKEMQTIATSEDYQKSFTADDFRVFKKTVPAWRHIVFTGTNEIINEYWHYSTPPYFRFCSFHDVTTGDFWSLTDLAKDPQKAYDRMISMIDKSTAKNIKGNNYTVQPELLHPSETKDMDSLFSRLSNGGSYVRTNNPNAILPLQNHNNVQVESQQALYYQQTINDLLGGNAFQGVEAETTQTATEVRTLEKNAQVSTLLYMDNFARYKNAFTSYLIEVIKDIYTPDRTFRVMGEVQSKKIMETLQKAGIYKESIINKGSYGWVDLSNVQSLANANVDIVIEDVEATNSEKDTKFNQLMAINAMAVQNGFAPLPFEYLLNFTKLDPTVKNGLIEWQKNQEQAQAQAQAMNQDAKKGEFLTNLIDKVKPNSLNQTPQVNGKRLQ